MRGIEPGTKQKPGPQVNNQFTTFFFSKKFYSIGLNLNNNKQVKLIIHFHLNVKKKEKPVRGIEPGTP